MTENSKAAKTGGNIAKRARKDFENRTETKVVTSANYLPPGKKKKAVALKRDWEERVNKNAAK